MGSLMFGTERVFHLFSSVIVRARNHGVWHLPVLLEATPFPFFVAGKFEYRVTEESLMDRLTTNTLEACLSIHENCRSIIILFKDLSLLVSF